MRRPPLALTSFYGATLLVQVVTFILRPTAIYRAIELDAPTQLLGAIGASFAVVPLLLAVGIGALTDRLGEKTLMITGGGILLGSTACFALLGSSIPGLLLATVTLGVGHLCSVVGQQAYVANITDSSRYDTAFGHYTFAASAGQAAGPGFIALFGGSAAIPDTGAIFVASAAVAATLLVVTLALPRTTGARGRTGDQGSLRTLVRRPGLLRALTVSSVVLAAVDISLVYLPALGAERDVSAATIGALLSVRAVFSMASRLFLGQLAARLGRGRLLVGSVAGAAVGMALLPAPLPVWSLFVVVAAMGFGLGVGQPMTMSWLADATPPGLRGRAMSLRLTGNRLGQVVVPTAAGAFAASAGAGAVLWATAAALGAVALAARRIRPAGT